MPMEKWQKNLYTVWFTQLLSLMGFGFGLPFIPFFIQDLGINDPSQVKLWTGILIAAPGAAMGLMAIVWGILADRIGKKPMLIRAMASGVAVLIGMGLSRSVYMLLVFRILQGLLTGTVSSSTALVASGTPDHKLSYALGFVSSSRFIGFSLGPAVGGIVAEHFGYRTSFFVGSAIMFLGLLFVIFLIAEPHKYMNIAWKRKNIIEGTAHKRKTVTSSLIFFLILLFFIRLSRVLPNPFIPLYIQDLRGTIAGSARMTGLLSGGIGLMSALSGLTLSRLGDKMNKLKLLSILIGTGTAASLIITFFPGFIPLVISLLVTYFLIGGVEPLLMSITSGKVDYSSRGFLFGLQTAVGSAGWSLSPLLGSWVSISYSMRGIFLLFSILLGLTLIISVFINRRYSRFRE